MHGARGHPEALFYAPESPAALCVICTALSFVVFRQLIREVRLSMASVLTPVNPRWRRPPERRSWTSR
ncbi:hypothetical protein ACGFZQ_28500 [Streptomyces sp. NPDC048254]|uniref:hypothetical protein n=1 Tax=Streptomyces sp. NPDC048254 TaxID=3365525 RepID=UPI003710A027